MVTGRAGMDDQYLSMDEVAALDLADRPRLSPRVPSRERRPCLWPSRGPEALDGLLAPPCPPLGSYRGGGGGRAGRGVAFRTCEEENASMSWGAKWL